MKQNTECLICGGATDGTPSGTKRHEATQKHLNAEYHVNRIAEQGETDGTDGIVAVEAPDEYSSDEATKALYEQKRAVTVDLLASAKRIKELDAGLRWRQKHNSDNAALISKWAGLLDTAKAAQAELVERQEALAAELETASGARSVVVRDFWDGIRAEVEEQITGQQSDVLLNNYNGTFNLFLATGKVLTNRDGEEYPETRFGFEATVRAPERRWSDKTDGATINWGTMGSLSVEAAKDMVRLHAIAIEIAAYLDKRVKVSTAE